ncbi:MAG: HAD-IC family P-type ATPase, partial [Chloroflexi bacterium]|nr:HAD-IC family P-type ATPase [Chloroflexota bacterium]
MADESRNQRYRQQWHTLSAAETAGKLGVEIERGLSAEQVRQQLARVGPNQLRAEKSEPIWRTFLEELREPMVLLLLFTGVLYAIWGEPEDALVIFSVILVLNTIEVYNEQRARKAIASLHKLAAPSAAVRREGHHTEVPVEQIVPGDVILLQDGRRIPADARLVDAYGLSVDESSLTGESVPVDKDAGALLGADAPLAERRNLLFAGTAITRGRGTALVVATGAATELGRVAGMARAVKPEDALV